MESIKKGNYLNQKINGYSTQVGILDVNKPHSCYLLLTGYVKPDEEKDLNTEMKMFERMLRFWVDDACGQLLAGKLNPKMPIIKNVDWSTSEVRTNLTRVNNVYSFFSVEITLFFIDGINIRDEKQADTMSLILYSLTDFLEETRDLSFKPTRK